MPVPHRISQLVALSFDRFPFVPLRDRVAQKRKAKLGFPVKALEDLLPWSFFFDVVVTFSAQMRLSLSFPIFNGCFLKTCSHTSATLVSKLEELQADVDSPGLAFSVANVFLLTSVKK